MPAYGAKSWSLTRSIDDPLAFQQTSIWESRADFERYWFSEEIEDARASDHRPLRPAAPARLAHAARRRVAADRDGRSAAGQFAGAFVGRFGDEGAADVGEQLWPGPVPGRW